MYNEKLNMICKKNLIQVPSDLNTPSKKETRYIPAPFPIPPNVAVTICYISRVQHSTIERENFPNLCDKSLGRGSLAEALVPSRCCSPNLMLNDHPFLRPLTLIPPLNKGYCSYSLLSYVKNDNEKL